LYFERNFPSCDLGPVLLSEFRLLISLRSMVVVIVGRPLLAAVGIDPPRLERTGCLGVVRGKKGSDLRGPLARSYTWIISRIARPVAQILLHVKSLPDPRQAQGDRGNAAALVPAPCRTHACLRTTGQDPIG
jgi:hypothetical protein